MGMRELLALAAAAAAASPCALAEGASEEQIAQDLENPIAHRISVPFQYNWEHEVGADRDGTKAYLKIQPLFPIQINDDWGIISRTVAQIVDQHLPPVGDGSQAGLGDTTQSFFLGRAHPPRYGVLWGAGPIIQLPFQSQYISSGKWGAGPTAAVLIQVPGWSAGVLVYHIWSVAGAGTQDTSKTNVQPSVSYTTKRAWTVSVGSESVYDWKQSQWTVPVNVSLSRVMKFANQPVSVGGGARYFFDSPSSGSHGWGARFTVTYVFPA